MRIFQGVEYWNCDDCTDEEMAVIADWENATNETKQAILAKHGWTDMFAYRGPSELVKFEGGNLSAMGGLGLRSPACHTS